MSATVDVLKQIAPNIYSYRDKFAELWDIDTLIPKIKDKTVVIVWDDIPPRKQDVVATNKYLTPIDWAVAFSLAVHDAATAGKKDDKKLEYPDLRILILDLNSQSISNADSVRFFNQSPQIMPWVRLFHPFDADKLIKNLIDNIGDKPDDKVSSMKDAIEKSDMPLIRNIWAAFLTKPSTPGDHHAIANLVGPLLLMGDNTGEDQHTKALKSLMKALGLIPEKAKGEALPWINWDAAPWKDRLNRLTTDEGKLNLILIDDQYHQGWGEVLRLALGVPYAPMTNNIVGENEKIVVKAFDSAEDILTILEKLTDKDQRFQFSLGGKKDIPEVLFLDLRLFSGKDEKEEAAFFERLISLAEKFIEDGTNNLPWKGFTTAEIEKVKNWIKPENQKREDDNYATALTLLPRILALTDMSLPIIIFSSTGRRDIAEKFKGYDNIITDFDKPKFTVDMPEDIAEQTKRKFEEAFEKAVLLLQGREKCRKIIQNAACPKPLETEKKGKHVELYIDEDFLNAKAGLKDLPEGFENKIPNRIKDQLVHYDGRLELQGWMNEQEKIELLSISNDEQYQTAIKNIYKESQNHAVRVGGLFAIFSDNTLEKAQMKADLFDDVCTSSGILYFDPTPNQNTNKEIKRKKANSASELAEAMKNAHRPEGLFFVRLSFTISGPDPSIIGDPFNPRSADNLYRHTLSTLIELFLSEVLPALFGQGAKNGSVSIFVATKKKPLTGKDLNMATYSTGQLPSENSKNFLTTISRDSIHPFVLDTLSYHQIEPKICRAIGITLPYKKSFLAGTKKPKFYICRVCKEQRTIDELAIRDIKPCSCGTTYFKPDYRALHYIADEILGHITAIKDGHRTGYGAYVEFQPWGFDEEIKNLGTTIRASRKLDNKDVVGSIIDIDPNLSGITQLLSGRIATELKTLKGWDFCRTAVGLTDEKSKAINLFRFLMPRVPKNRGIAKAHSAPRSNNMSKNNPPRTASIRPIQGGLEQKTISTPAVQDSSGPINRNSKKEVNTVKNKSGTFGKMSDLFKNVEWSKSNNKP